MCLDNYRFPTEEEKKKKYIGYKIVWKIENSNEFRPEFQYGTDIKYVIGETAKAKIPEKIDYENHGIHIYLDSEVEKYPFEEDHYLALIKVEFEGKDILALGENPNPCLNLYLHQCPCPYPYLYPYRCPYSKGCTVKKVRVVEEVKK